ncbi:uncharacterized protein V6R79_006645 [Siganus canaliculatus]
MSMSPCLHVSMSPCLHVSMSMSMFPVTTASGREELVPGVDSFLSVHASLSVCKAAGVPGAGLERDDDRSLSSVFECWSGSTPAGEGPDTESARCQYGVSAVSARCQRATDASGDKVWLASVPDADPTPSRRVLRRRRKKQNTEKTQEIDKESETVENRLDAIARTDDTDSESEEHGMWFDLFVEPPRIKMDEKVSEPFSLDLDVLASDQTGQPEEVEPEAIQEGEGNDVGCEETVNDTETQETSQTENQIQGHETADADTLSQEDTVTDTDNNTVTRRTQRVRRPPLKLTYDVPGQPRVKMAPSVKPRETREKNTSRKIVHVEEPTSFVTTRHDPERRMKTSKDDDVHSQTRARPRPDPGQTRARPGPDRGPALGRLREQTSPSRVDVCVTFS